VTSAMRKLLVDCHWRSSHHDTRSSPEPTSTPAAHRKSCSTCSSAKALKPWS